MSAIRSVSKLATSFRDYEKLKKQIGENYRVIPVFEKTVFEHIYRKHYSLQSNELIKCRWEQYKSHIEERVVAPFQFPDIRDLHFYNGDIRFLPPLSIFRKTDHRKKLKPGPGVDHLGQMPIPQELLMKRGVHKEEPHHVLHKGHHNVSALMKKDKMDVKKHTGKNKS